MGGFLIPFILPRRSDCKRNPTFGLQVAPETYAVMKWIRSLPFVQSASLHGGELVTSYAFDFSRDLHEERMFSPTPDEQVTDRGEGCSFSCPSSFTAILFLRLSSGWLAPTRTITPPCQTTTQTGVGPLFTGPEASSTERCGTALPEVSCSRTT